MNILNNVSGTLEILGNVSGTLEILGNVSGTLDNEYIRQRFRDTEDIIATFRRYWRYYSNVSGILEIL